MKKITLIGIVIISLLFIPLSYKIDASIFNNVQRAGAAFELRDFIVHDVWHVHSLGDVVEKFVSYYHHYTFISGFIEWPPLQLMLLTISSLFFGKSYLAIFIVDALFIFLMLFYTVKLTEKYYKGREWWIIGVIITTPFVLQQMLSNFLELGMWAFTLMFAYYFMEYLKEKNKKYLYISSFIFGLGMLYKLQFVLVAAPAGILFLRHLWKTRHERWNIDFRAIGIAFIIFVIVMIPYFGQQLILYKLGISNINERTIGRFDNFNSINKTVWLSPNDYAFRDGISKDEEMILNRKGYYHTPVISKLYTVFFSVFYNIVLFVAFLFIIRELWKKKLWETDLFFLVYFLTTFLFFTILGTLPRYLIGATLSLYFLVLRLKKYNMWFSLIIIGNIILSLFFFGNILMNNHVMSKQYDYDMVNANGTTITTMTKRQSLSFLMKGLNVSVLYPPEKKEEMDALLAKYKFNMSPKHLSSFNMEYERVRNVIVHKGEERGIVGEYDYNLTEYMDERPEFRKRIIDGIYVYTR